MRFARLVFGIAGAAGIAAILPLFAPERRVGAALPPPITHPEFYDGFAGAALARQVAFLVIASDPARFRPLMLAGILERVGFGVPAMAPHLRGRAARPVLGAGLFDPAPGALFAAAWRAAGSNGRGGR